MPPQELGEISLQTAQKSDHVSEAHLNEWVTGSAVNKSIATLAIESLTAAELNERIRPQTPIQTGGWWVRGVNWRTGEPMGNRYGQGKPDKPHQRNEGKPAKYMTASGLEPDAVFLPMPDKDYWLNVYSDKTLPRIWTEGAKKAGAGLTIGLPTIALTGVWNWGKDGQLAPDVKKWAQQGTRHVICFDSDYVEKDSCRAAISTLVRLLLAEGVTSVKIAAWDSQWKGMDDYIKANGTEAFKKIIDNAMTIEQWGKQFSQPSSVPTDPDERLRLELKALLKETDPIKRMRRRAKIASHYNLRKSDIEQALKHLDECSKSKQPRRMGLDELFDLPQVGVEYVIPGMLPVGETALLVASPKAGKSLLAYDAAFAVATGEDNFLGEQVKQGRVLIIQCDESVNTARGRLIKRGFRHEDAANVQFVDSFKITQLDLLEEWLESFRPTLVIVDSLRRISAGREVSENSAEFADAVYQLKELIARYNAAAILIHHTNKNSEAVGIERVRGSSAIAGAVWGVWELSHILKPDPNNKKKMIIDPKDPSRIFNITARDVEGQRLQIEFDPENNHWLSLGEVGVEASEINECQTREDKVLSLLKPIAPTGLEASEINAQLNIGRGVYNCLHRLLAKGIIGSRPSAKDRRRTVYYYPKNDSADFLPPPSPTPTDQNEIEYAETYTQQGLENRSQFDLKFDLKSISKNEDTPPVSTSKQEQTSVPEVDLKNRSQGGGGGVTKPEINSITRPSGENQWNPGDKFRSVSQHKSYKKYLGKELVVRQDNPSRLTVSAEGTRDEFCYRSIERVIDSRS
jgi:KaiC/GvpD/RAD55 family RecA-like ATPase